MQIEYRGEQIEYHIVRSRRRTVGLTLKAPFQVEVRASGGIPCQRLRDLVAEKADWIVRKSRQLQALDARTSDLTIPEKKYEAYRGMAEQHIPRRVAVYAGKMGVTYSRIRIKDQKTLWGSCSSRKNLNFNWRLVMAPGEVLDYVVVHELCHLKHMNHSAEFWDCVEEILPEYREHRRWLKVHGGELSRVQPDA